MYIYEYMYIYNEAGADLLVLRVDLLSDTSLCSVREQYPPPPLCIYLYIHI